MKQLSIYDYENVRPGVILTYETRRESYETVDKQKRLQLKCTNEVMLIPMKEI